MKKIVLLKLEKRKIGLTVAVFANIEARPPGNEQRSGYSEAMPSMPDASSKVAITGSQERDRKDLNQGCFPH